MTFQTTAVIQALHELVEVRRGASQDDGYQFALAWMVGARMAQLGMLSDGARLVSLTDKDTWTKAHSEIGELCAGIIWGKGATTQSLDQEVARAASITGYMLESAPLFYLSVPDALWHLPSVRNSDLPVLAPEVCDLLFCALGAPRGAKVWIPFDPVGQFASRAMRLELEVEFDGPHAWPTDSQRLCRALLGRFDENPLSTLGEPKNPDGKRDFELDYLIAVPPMGARLPVGMGWRQWEGNDERLIQNRMLVDKVGPSNQLRLDRSDAWTPAALWPRVKQRAVFMAAQSLLFARGQEQRLREAWIRNGYPIDLILSLPSRMHSYASIAPALLVFDRNSSGHELRMGDLSKLTVRTGFNGRAAKTLDLEKSLEVLNMSDSLSFDRRLERITMGGIDQNLDKPENIVQVVSFNKILDADCNLQPSRHLQPELLLLGARLPLRDLVEVIRAPVPTSDPYSVAAIEVGIPDLGNWRAIKPISPGPGAQVRIVQIRERRIFESSLKKGDIVMSIKGTIGKTALIGQSMVEAIDATSGTGGWPLVTSGNCIALRPKLNKISSEYLMLYFRSEDFKRQCDALLAGAVIPHVTPDSLCDSVKVPIPSLIVASSKLEKYHFLCDLESQAEEVNWKISNVVKTLWTSQI